LLKNIAKNRAKQPGTTPFAHAPTDLKTDPGAFRFCQIEYFSEQLNHKPTDWKHHFQNPRKYSVERRFNKIITQTFASFFNAKQPSSLNAAPAKQRAK
jgi:hypothetical protein